MPQTRQDKELNTSVKLENNLNAFYEKKDVKDTEFWYGNVPLDNNSSIVWMRRRGIQTTQDIGTGIRWTLFLKSLLNWDFRYDPYDRKIYVYWWSNKDFSRVPDFWSSTRSWTEWEYCIYNWQLYKAKQTAGYTDIPWTVAWEPYRQPVINFQSILPLDNSYIEYQNWFSFRPVNTWWNTLISDYTVVIANDEFYSWTEAEIPYTWYYILNSKESRGSRDWNVTIASRIEIDDWSWRATLTEYYKPMPTITASWGVTINHWTITQDTTANTRMWMLNKWDKIRVVLYQDWTPPINILADKIQILRIF